MKRVNQPQLDGCEKMPLRFKDVDCVNGEGQTLARCKICDGSGSICKGEKQEASKASDTPPQTVYANFTGADRSKFHRQGYAITCETCRHCRGAGLVVEGEK